MPQSVESVIDFISQQGLKPGSLLPKEEELSKLLGIGRQNLREALAILGFLNVIERKKGVGTQIQHIDPTGFSSHLQDSIELIGRLAFVGSRFDPHGLTELQRARAAFEGCVAFEATLYSREDDFSTLHKQVEQMIETHKEILRHQEPTTKLRESFLASDERFHKAILVASHNSVLNSFGGIIVRSFLMKSPKPDIFRRGGSGKIIDEHRQILNHIELGFKNRDSVRLRQHAELAQKCMYEHLIRLKEE